MTPIEFKTKVRELFQQIDQHLEHNLDHLIQSGALNVAAIPPGDYGQAKIALIALLQSEARHWEPLDGLTRQQKRQIKNLRHFI